MKLVISGPDGVGKSTIVRAVADHLLRQKIEVEITWRRFGSVLSRVFNFFARFTGASFYENGPNGLLIGYHCYRGVAAWFYIILVYFDCLVFIIPKWTVIDMIDKNKAKLIDRFIIDIVSDLILSTENPRGVIFIFDRILRWHMRNYCCVILTCPTQVVFERRPDVFLDRSYLRKVEIYKLLRRYYKIPEISTDKMPPRIAAEEILRLCK
jgi:hypothetical protein